MDRTAATVRPAMHRTVPSRIGKANAGRECVAAVLVPRYWKPPQHMPTMNQPTSSNPAKLLSNRPNSRVPASMVANGRVISRTSSSGSRIAVASVPSRTAVATQPASATDIRPSVTTTATIRGARWSGSEPADDSTLAPIKARRSRFIRSPALPGVWLERHMTRSCGRGRLGPSFGPCPRHRPNRCRSCRRCR